MADRIYVHNNIIVEGTLNTVVGSINTAARKTQNLAVTGSFDAISLVNYTCQGNMHRMFSNDVAYDVESASIKLEEIQEKIQSLSQILKNGPDELLNIDRNQKNQLVDWKDRSNYKSARFQNVVKANGGSKSFFLLVANSGAVAINKALDDSGGIYKYLSGKWDEIDDTVKGYCDHIPLLDKAVEFGWKKITEKEKAASTAFGDDEFNKNMKVVENWDQRAREAKEKGDKKETMHCRAISTLMYGCTVINASIKSVYNLLPEDARQLMEYSTQYTDQIAREEFREGKYLKSLKSFVKGFGVGLVAIGRVTTDLSAKAIIGMIPNKAVKAVVKVGYGGLMIGAKWIGNKLVPASS